MHLYAFPLLNQGDVHLRSPESYFDYILESYESFGFCKNQNGPLNRYTTYWMLQVCIYQTTSPSLALSPCLLILQAEMISSEKSLQTKHTLDKEASLNDQTKPQTKRFSSIHFLFHSPVWKHIQQLPPAQIGHCQEVLVVVN